MLSSKPNLLTIGMITLLDYAIIKPQIQFKHELGTLVVDETLAMEKVKIVKIVEWIMS
jgi:hypothetical protein